jgi:hypothetical protein
MKINQLLKYFFLLLAFLFPASAQPAGAVRVPLCELGALCGSIYARLN